MKNKGITLIALVITIVVLLILAGVSIAALFGTNGIIQQANNSKIKTQIENEKEALTLELTESRINIELNNQISQTIGETLYDKTVENGNIWHTIFNTENNKTYGTGWNYIKKDTELKKIGKTTSNWLINYNNGELLELQEGKYTELSWNMNLTESDNLIFNLDSKIMEGATKDNFQERLGENVQLINFNWNDNSGVNNNTINLDGIDDYIKIKYDKSSEKDILKQNGFTFEYYGTLNLGTSYNSKNEIINETYKGLFCYWDGDESSQANFRVGVQNNNIVKWNAGWGKFYSDFSQYGYNWNQHFLYDENLCNKLFYFAITLDTTNSYEKEGTRYYPQSLYINGQKYITGGYNASEWDYFINNNISSLNYFCIGRSSMTGDGWWHYMKMNAYALRLYNKSLSEDQVSNNYDKSVAYYNIEK